MTSVDVLSRRVQVIEDHLQTELSELEKLEDKYARLSDSDRDQVAQDVAIARVKADITRSHLEEVKLDLASEMTRMKSPGYKQALKDMQEIDKDNITRCKSIDALIAGLVSALDEFASECKRYDRLKARHQTGKPDILGHIYTYPHIIFIKSAIDKMTSDHIYKTRDIT